jgi:phosphate transport system permease protein
MSTIEPDARATALFTHTRRLRKRKLVNKLMEGLALAAALLAVAVLAIVVYTVARRGASALNLDFFIKTPAAVFGVGGGAGIANAIVGSIVIVGIATALAMPLGVMIAIFVSELAPSSIANGVRLALDVINGLPTIVTGIFIFTIIVLSQGQSGFAAATALAIIALPLVSRSTQEVLRLVPSTLREAGLALGASRWRTTLGVILPTSLGGILTGTTLSIARVAGETAPLLFTSSLTAAAVTWDPRQPMQAIPLTIFEYSEQPYPELHAQAWAAGIVLLGFVLILSLGSKLFLTRARKKLSK